MVLLELVSSSYLLRYMVVVLYHILELRTHLTTNRNLNIT